MHFSLSLEMRPPFRCRHLSRLVNLLPTTNTSVIMNREYMALSTFFQSYLSITERKTIPSFEPRTEHGLRGNKPVYFCLQRINVILQEPRGAQDWRTEDSGHRRRRRKGGSGGEEE